MWQGNASDSGSSDLARWQRFQTRVFDALLDEAGLSPLEAIERYAPRPGRPLSTRVFSLRSPRRASRPT